MDIDTNINTRFTHRCAACGEYWWDAHACQKGLAEIVNPLDLSGVKLLDHSGTQAALELDAARYRWLRERNACLDDVGIFTAIRMREVDGSFSHNQLIALEEMDAAIDSEMKG